MKWDTVVIGGGLSGLTAAIFAAQAGNSVVLVEKNKKLGGRASSDTIKGSNLSMGAHALYQKGAAMSIFRELGILVEAGTIPFGGIAVREGKLFPLPVNPGALLSTKLLTFSSKMRFGQLMTFMKKINPAPFNTVSWQDWVINKFPRDQSAQQLMLALGRLWSYGNCPEMMNAGAMIKQGQIGLDGVYYLHQGWQNLANKLKERAEAEGATIVQGGVKSVCVDGDRVEGVLLENGNKLSTSTVIAAVSPDEAIRILNEEGDLFSKGLQQWKDRSTAAYASCLDVVVKQLPYPKRAFALHMERPLYYSNHSMAAKLNDEGHQVIHLLKYQPGEEAIDTVRDRKELEAWLTTIQPGWKKSVVVERFLPKMTVTHAVSTVNGATRPTEDVTGLNGFYISGDWVGQQGMLADAAVASAKQAAHKAIKLLRNSN